MAVRAQELPAPFDLKIHSVYCAKINAQSASSTAIDDLEDNPSTALTTRADTDATWGTGCSLSDGQNLRGTRSTNLPSNEQCFDLEYRNEGFDWSVKVRSFIVFAYNRCQFYT